MTITSSGSTFTPFYVNGAPQHMCYQILGFTLFSSANNQQSWTGNPIGSNSYDIIYDYNQLCLQSIVKSNFESR